MALRTFQNTERILLRRKRLLRDSSDPRERRLRRDGAPGGVEPGDTKAMAKEPMGSPALAGPKATTSQAGAPVPHDYPFSSALGPYIPGRGTPFSR